MKLDEIGIGRFGKRHLCTKSLATMACLLVVLDQAHVRSEPRARKLMAGEPQLIFVESPLDASLTALPVMGVARESSTSERSTGSRAKGRN